MRCVISTRTLGGIANVDPIRSHSIPYMWPVLHWFPTDTLPECAHRFEAHRDVWKRKRAELEAAARNAEESAKQALYGALTAEIKVVADQFGDLYRRAIE